MKVNTDSAMKPNSLRPTRNRIRIEPGFHQPAALDNTVVGTGTP